MVNIIASSNLKINPTISLFVLPYHHCTWFEMWRVKNRVVSDNADHAMDDLAINFGNIGNINLVGNDNLSINFVRC